MVSPSGPRNGSRTGPVTGKVAFITGAARGQGRTHAVRLASHGADIVAVDLCEPIDSVPYPLATADDLAATVKLVEEAGAAGVVARRADVRDRSVLTAAAGSTSATRWPGWYRMRPATSPASPCRSTQDM